MIIWEEVNQYYHQGSVGEFTLFYIFVNGVDSFTLETTLPLTKKNFSLSEIKDCKKRASRILQSFITSINKEVING